MTSQEKEIDQEEKDRLDKLVRIGDVLSCMKIIFDETNVSLMSRSCKDQTLIGNFITVLESDLKKSIKSIKN